MKNDNQPALQQNYVSAVRASRVDVYGVEMTSIQEIMFSKFMANNGIAMNTKTKEQRKEIAENWLKNQ